MNVRIAVLLLSVFVAAAGAQALPDGKGKEILEGTCSECHGSDEVKGLSWTAERWDALVGSMVNKGATLSDEERKTLIGYLVANFGPVNANKATAADLQKIGLSSGEADAVLRYRQTNGNFKGWDDFSKVPGVSAAKMNGIKDSIIFQ